MIAAVYNTDCLAWLKAQPDAAFDVCITDPPFDERTHAGARSFDKKKGYSKLVDFAPLSPDVFVPEILRVTRRWVICFCALEQIGEYRRVADDAYVRSTAWVKRGGFTPQFSGDRPAQNCEGLVLMHRAGHGRKRWAGGGDTLELVGPTTGTEEIAFLEGFIGPNSRVEKKAADLHHPTLKPLWLMRTLVDLFAAPGDHILDPFMGSGTTGVAALERGHPFTGLELDPRYFTEAQARIELTKAQPDMLAGQTVKAKQERLSL